MKYNTATARPRNGAAVITASGAPMTNHQGGLGVARGDAKSELFLMAVSDFGGEDTFYEKGNDRLDRLVALARAVAAEDPAWAVALVGWLRTTANMRTVSLVIGLEAAAAGAGREAVVNALARPDEPAEAIAYWHARHGRRIPAAVKRGIADAAEELYGERAYAKYNSGRSAYQFADVIELTHPKPLAPWQSDLFKYAIDSRHRETAIPERLGLLRRRADWFASHAKSLDSSVLAAAGLTWEDVLSAVGNSARVWEAIIPNMGYMALLRNLRNFEEARVSEEVLDGVAARLRHPEQVEKSKQLPLRFLSAYRNTPTLRFKHPLEQAVQHSVRNVPSLPGRTLILVDRSGSMFQELSARSSVTRADAGAIFGAALAMRAEHPTLVIFGGNGYWNNYGPESTEVNVPQITSLLPLIEQWPNMGGTETERAIRQHFAGHDRVVLLTDEQHSGYDDPLNAIPANVPVYVWNLAGYRPASGEAKPNRTWMGGLTDAGFNAIPLMEAGRDQRWPWEE